jgi:hypothetical protein
VAPEATSGSATAKVEKTTLASASQSDEADHEGSGKARRPFSDTRADTPRAKDERSRTSAPLRVSVPPPDAGSSLSRWLMLSLVLAALIMGGRWYFQSRDTGAPPAPTVAADAPAAAAPAAAEAAPTAAQPTPAAAAESAAPGALSAAAQPAGVESAAPSAEPAAPSAEPAAPAPSASASATSEAPGSRTVIVKISPSTARLFYHGKPVGASPVTVVLGPNEKRRSFEVGGPGWVTRRLVVDGSKPELFIGLKPAK